MGAIFIANDVSLRGWQKGKAQPWSLQDYLPFANPVAASHGMNGYNHTYKYLYVDPACGHCLWKQRPCPIPVQGLIEHFLFIHSSPRPFNLGPQMSPCYQYFPAQPQALANHDPLRLDPQNPTGMRLGLSLNKSYHPARLRWPHNPPFGE